MGEKPCHGEVKAHASVKSRKSARSLQLFLFGHAASQCGTWIQFVAVGWLAYKLTNSGVALGVIAAATFGPLLLFGPWAGTIVDRCDKRRLLLIVQVLTGAQAAVLGGLVLGDAITPPLLYLLAVAGGVGYAVESPTRNAIVAELVAPQDIAHAVSLTSAVAAGGRVLAPVLTGPLILLAGIGWCFEAKAVCYLAAVVALRLVRRAELHAPEPAARERGQVVAGLRYVWAVTELRTALLLTAVVATFGFNHQVVIPLLAERTFDGGAGTYTLLYSAMGVGAVAGALAAGRADVDVRFLGRAALVFGMASGLVAVAPVLPLAVLGAALTGATALLFITAATTLLQKRSEPAMRGRVMALSAMVVLGGVPIGAPVVGLVAEQLGPRSALGVGAVVAVGAALATLWPARPVHAANRERAMPTGSARP